MEAWRRLSRRSLLKGGAVAIGAAAFGVPRRAHADWGAFESGSQIPPSPAPPFSYPGYKVFEIFLYGGLTPWETFYWVPSTATGMRRFDNALSSLGWVSSAACGTVPTGVQPRDFPTASPVQLGPLTMPLWRDYILDRMRVVVQRHDLKPHEGAIPLALSGLRLGNPAQAGMGAAVQHRFYSTLPAMSARRNVPASYVFLPSDRASTDNFQAAGAIGAHGADARPLVMSTGTSLGQAIARLGRTQGSIQFASLDPLITAYRSQYGAKLDWGGARTRSRAFAEYSSATGNLMNAPNWISLFGTVNNPSDDPSCAVVGLHGDNQPVQGIGVAVRLLTSTVMADATSYPAAAYACVVDGGLVSSGGAGYDGHSGLINATATNLWNTLTALSRAIRTDATDTTAGKINLDDTLVIINTEFGRTPDLPTSGGDGRDHWPEGYASVLIGGPITSAAAVVGQIDPASGNAIAPLYSPTDFRAACLMAAGVEPIVPGVTFSVAQLFGNTVAVDSVARAKIRTEILGVP